MLMNERGFTLIETMVASVVLGIGLVGLWTMQIASIDSNSKSYVDATAIFDGTEQVEIWMGRLYSHMDLTDTNGNGTNRDNDFNGIDDTQIASVAPNNYRVNNWVENNLASANYGLNDYPGCSQVNQSLVPGCTDQAADHTLTTTDGTVIYWNVAIDYPVEYTKTTRIHMLRPLEGFNPITFDYIKEEGI